MKLRRLASGVAVGLGLVAAGNALLARRGAGLGPPLSGDAHTYRFRGMDVAYTEAGDPDAPAVLFLHGAHPTASSHAFDPVFDRLAERYRVVAPDLPGFGRSDRPPIDYDADLYADFVAAFAADVAPGAACVASGLSGAFAALAARDGVSLSRLVLICPTTTTTPVRRPWIRRLLRAPVVGTGLFNLLVSRPSIRYHAVEHGYADPWRFTEARLAYLWRTAHQPGARFAPASLLAGDLDPGVNLGSVLADADVPVALVWGSEAELMPLSYGRRVAETADARLVVVDPARLLPHVEHPDRFVELLEGELRGAGGRGEALRGDEGCEDGELPRPED